MRLIDADELTDEIQKLSIAVSAKDSVLIHIATQPTIDAVPVVHGSWWDRAPMPYTCGSCGNEQIYKLSVCPHCGAKMDGQEPIRD